MASLADAMFEFPDSEGGEEKGFGPGQSTGSGHLVFGMGMTVRTISGSLGFFLWLWFADGTRSRMRYGEMATVHNSWCFEDFHTL